MATKKKNWLEELQNIATQTVGPVQTNPATADDIVNQSAVQKVNQITELASKMYPEDMNSRFDFWKSRLDVGQLPQGGKQAYWNTYQTMHPEGIDGATRDFVTTTRKELDYIPGMAEKEFFLRERIAQTPDWAKKQLEPILAEVSTTVANANYNKAQQVYASDLQTRVNAFLSNQQLDPDVAIDDHVNDMLKLEQMNLMEMASIMNGRVGIMKDGRSFIPAFGMTDSEQIVKDAAIAPSLEEQFVVREIGLQPIKNAVTTNIVAGRSQIKTQEVTSKNIAQQYLRTGKYDMFSWDKAFSMMPDVPLQDKISLGLRGEITAGRIKTEKQLAQSIYMALSKYGDQLPTVSEPTQKRPEFIPDDDVWAAAQAQLKWASTRPFPYPWEARSLDDIVGRGSAEYQAARDAASEAMSKLSKEKQKEANDLFVMLRKDRMQN